VRYEDVRVVLSATPRGRFRRHVSFAGVAPIDRPFVRPRGVDGESLYEEWYGSFGKRISAKRRQAIEERRRRAGEKLFQALFASAAPRILERLKVLEERFKAEMQSRPQSKRPRRGLRVRLLLGNAWGKGKANAAAVLPVAHLPHELMVPPGLPQFLARRPYVSIVRTIGVEDVIEPVAVSGNLRILVAVAQPRECDALGWKKEAARIRRGLAGLTDTTVEVLGNASFETTCERLRDGGFHVLHFIGHGGFDRRSGQWYLLFEKNRKAQFILAETLADRLSNLPSLQLAVLNACHTGELARKAGGNPIAGVAAALSVFGVPAVVGMQVAVTDSAAIDFSTAFYSALRERVPIEVALSDARQAIDICSPEWATPVLYLRGDSSDLFETEPVAPVIRTDNRPELKLGIRTLVKSARFPHLAEWAISLATESEKLLALEKSFEGRFIVRDEWWRTRVLPRLNRFLAAAVAENRPLELSLVAHSTVAFAAGYYFHTKTATKISLLQATPGKGKPEGWSQDVGKVPRGRLWKSFEVDVLDRRRSDVAIAVEIACDTSADVRSYLKESRTKIGKLIIAEIAGGAGKARVESGAHAYQLARQLQQWLKDHTGNRARRRLHLFISAPNGFVFFFGQLARNLGPVRLYEYDFEGTRHGSYEPSLDLPQAAPE
jgi:hypothetical protein